MITIISDDIRHRATARRIDCRHLPNPNDTPKLRPRDGRDPEVRAHVMDNASSRAALAEGVSIAKTQGAVMFVCSAGRHRSVALAEECADQLRANGHQVRVEHRALGRARQKRERRGNTTQRGYGTRHQAVRRRLIFNLIDGTPCPGCGQPMFRDPRRNHDGRPLEADHEADLKHHGPGDANRLLCSTCNRSRGAGHDERLPMSRGGSATTPGRVIGWDWLD